VVLRPASEWDPVNPGRPGDRATVTVMVTVATAAGPGEPETVTENPLQRSRTGQLNSGPRYSSSLSVTSQWDVHWQSSKSELPTGDAA